MKPGATYRPDIDGLRAIAVLAVVVYHAFPSVLPGGFVGVDVFFVISGYLITGILLGEHDNQRFSFLRFYERRIKRLFPALFLVLLACMIAGWFVLFPDELRQLGKHVVGAATFISNILLFRETGYFDTAASQKPLLHLWSLGIEEQFYLIWPAILGFCLWRKWKVWPVLVAILVVSFVVNVRLSGAAAGFYLPLPRFWELLAGAGIAVAATSEGGRAVLAKMGHAAWIGAALMMIGIVVIDHSSSFPGFLALLPVGGTFLLIAAGPEAAINKHVLSLKPLVWIGLISYPLYLWHWPLLVFGRIIYGGTPPAGVQLALIAISFVLSIATYRLFENPVRRSARGWRIPIVLCVLVGVVAGAGLVAVKKRGFSNRYAAILRDLSYDHKAFRYTPCDSTLGGGDPPLTYCFQSTTSPPTHVVFGDSHADHIFAGLASIDKTHTWLLAGHPSCPPVSGVNVHIDSDRCQERSEKIIAYIGASPSITTVVLAYFGGYTQDADYAADHVASRIGPSAATITAKTSGSKSELFYQGLERAIDALERAGKRVVLLHDVPELPFQPRDCMARASFLTAPKERCEITRAAIDQRQANPRQIVARLQAAHPRLEVFDPVEALCSRDACAIERNDHFLYRDSHHLGLWGSQQFATSFLAWLR